MKKTYLYTLLITIMTLLTIAVWWFTTERVTIKPATFAQLPGWKTVKLKPSLNAFRLSCRAFLKQDPEKNVGTDDITLHVKDWLPACRAAMSDTLTSNKKIKLFFQTWFTPVEFYQHKPIRGLFTGYFLPLLHGNLNKTAEYNVPIYGIPSNMVTANLALFKPEFKNKRIVGRLEDKKLIPFYTREEINKGALHKKAPVLLWVNNPMDRLFLEIEGSGAVALPDGSRVYVGYAGENGANYTSIASVLIKRGLMTPDTASSEHIKTYLNTHPDMIDDILNQNKSFVFFRKLRDNSAFGAQGVALTPGYSLAVDRTWVPYGTPTWLSTTISSTKTNEPFNRLMIAQDTGGAIRGIVRGDVFWGAGIQASFTASHMRDEGRYWLLLPRHHQ